MADVEPVCCKSIWELIKETASSWDKINAPRLGAALAFYTLLSVAPLIVVCIAIAGMIFGPEAAQGQIRYQIQDMVGDEGGKVAAIAARERLQACARRHRGAVGFFILLFGASGVFGELRDSLNTVWGRTTNSAAASLGMIKYRFVSFAMVLGIGFLLLVSLVLSAGLSAAGKFFQGHLPLPEPALQTGSLIVSFMAGHDPVRLDLQSRAGRPHRMAGRRDRGSRHVAAILDWEIPHRPLLGKSERRLGVRRRGIVVVFMVWAYYSAQIFFLGAQFTRVFRSVMVPARSAALRARSAGEPFRRPGRPDLDARGRWSSTCYAESQQVITHKKHAVNITQAERIVSAIGGGLMAAAGIKRRSPAGIALALIGGDLLRRGITGHSYWYQAIGIAPPKKAGRRHYQPCLMSSAFASTSRSPSRGLLRRSSTSGATSTISAAS